MSLARRKIFPKHIYSGYRVRENSSMGCEWNRVVRLGSDYSLVYSSCPVPSSQRQLILRKFSEYPDDTFKEIHFAGTGVHVISGSNIGTVLLESHRLWFTKDYPKLPAVRAFPVPMADQEVILRRAEYVQNLIPPPPDHSDNFHGLKVASG